MRFVLALLAVMALLASPVTAAAAHLACAAAAVTMSGMDMPAASDMAQSGVQNSAAPCCDPGHHKMDRRACALACAGGCTVGIALPGADLGFSGAFGPVPLTPARDAPVLSYRPPGPERPPKSMV